MRHCLFLVTDNVYWVGKNLCSILGSLLEGYPVRRCDVKAQGAGDLVELSAADASNSTKAKSAKSVSLILI